MRGCFFRDFKDIAYPGRRLEKRSPENEQKKITPDVKCKYANEKYNTDYRTKTFVDTSQ